MKGENMINLQWSGLTRAVASLLRKKAPTILTGLGISGMLMTTVMAVRATPEAVRRIEDKKEEQKVEKLTVLDTVKVAWPCYISSVVTGGASVACLLCANSVNHRRQAALATAYTLSESAFSTYRDQVTQAIGEKKEQSIRDTIDSHRMETDPASKKAVIVTGRGSTLCYDSLSGRYFESDIETLRKIRNDLNLSMRSEMYISLNEFYQEIGLPFISIGDDLGWNIDKGYIDLNFSTQLSDDGRPCLVLNYDIAPDYNYF